MKHTDAIVLVGGYGVVGTQAARIIQARHPDLLLYIAGRNFEKAAALAEQLPNARPLAVDSTNENPLQGLLPRAIVNIANDPHNHVLMEAVHNRIAYLDITRWTEQLRAAIASLSSHQIHAPLLFASGWMAGVTSILAQAAAGRISQAEEIDISILYALQDTSGPNSVAYMDRLTAPFSVIEDGCLRQVFPFTDPRQVAFPGGYTARVFRFDTPDQFTLPAATGAGTVSTRITFDSTSTTTLLVMLVRSGLWRLISGRWFTRLRHAILYNPGEGAPHELVVSVRGQDQHSQPCSVRAELSDPLGQTHLTALGIVIQLERLLGRDGNPAPAPGIIYPDTSPQIDSALQVLHTYNARVRFRRIV